MSNELLKAALESDNDEPTLLPLDEPAPLPPPVEDDGKPLRKWQWKEYVEAAKKQHEAEKREGQFDAHKLLKSVAIRNPVSRYRVSDAAGKYSPIDIDCVDESEAVRRFYAHHKLFDNIELVRPSVVNIEHTVPRPAPAPTPAKTK
jgi:hypothetical protein